MLYIAIHILIYSCCKKESVMGQKTTQVNVRIEESLKAAGDAAFAQASTSPSQAVRWLWAFAAAHANDGGLERLLKSNPEIAQVAEMPSQHTAEERIAGFHAIQEKIAALTAKYPQHVIDEVNAIPDDELLAEAMLEKHFGEDAV